MSVADEYRVKAAELAAKARLEQDPVQRAELESLERSYLRLAIQAEKNADANIVYETPPERPRSVPLSRSSNSNNSGSPKRGRTISRSLQTETPPSSLPCQAIGTGL